MNDGSDKKEVKREVKKGVFIVSTLLFAVGAFFVLSSQYGLTGAAVAEQGLHASVFPVIGFGLIIAAAIILISGDRFPSLIGYDSLKARIERVSDSPAKILVLDTSLILSYSARDLENLSKTYTVKVTPDVVSQVKDPTLKAIINQYCKIETPDQKYVGIAQIAMRNTSKNKFFEVLKGTRAAPSNMTEGAKFRKLYQSLADRIKDRGEIVSQQKLIVEALRHYPVNPADVSVLALALESCDANASVLIGEKDVDLEEAAELVNNPRLRCFNPYAEIIQP